MAYFVAESDITKHPTLGDSTGPCPIRTAMAQHRTEAAATDPYGDQQRIGHRLHRFL
jgi:hypothetical protein